MHSCTEVAKVSKRKADFTRRIHAGVWDEQTLPEHILLSLIACLRLHVVQDGT